MRHKQTCDRLSVPSRHNTGPAVVLVILRLTQADHYLGYVPLRYIGSLKDMSDLCSTLVPSKEKEKKRRVKVSSRLKACYLGSSSD